MITDGKRRRVVHTSRRLDRTIAHGASVPSMIDRPDDPTCRNPSNGYRPSHCSRCGYKASTYGDPDCDPGDSTYRPECRETIGNLRHLSHMDRVRYGEESYGLPDETVMGPDIGYHGMNDVFGRIADLIDRGGCGNAYDGNEMGACDDGFECGRKAVDHAH